MKNKNFYILNRVKDFCLEVDKITINFPKKEYVIRERLQNDSMDILELVFYINFNRDKNIRKEKMYELLTKLSMLDFYMEKLHYNKIVNQKEFNKCLRIISDITKAVYGWIKSEG